MRAIFNVAGMTGDLRKGLWAECGRTATYLENVMVYDTTSAHGKMFGELPKWTNDLKIFGELAVILKVKKIRAKLEDRGFPAIFVGYTDDHASGVFRFF